MTAKVILKPHSNRWKSQARWPEVEAALKAAGVDFDVVVSEKKGAIVGLAEEAARAGFSPIIAAGGDGTIGETVNGMIRAAGSTDGVLGPLGIIPLGTANDLVFNSGLPTDLKEAVKVIAAGKTKAIDLCRCNDRFFINNSACGLEPYVTTKHERINWIKGMARYLVAAVWANTAWSQAPRSSASPLVTAGSGSVVRRGSRTTSLLPHSPLVSARPPRG